MRTNSYPPISTTHELTTERLTLRPWRVEDAQAALDVYGHAEVTRWLSLATDLQVFRLRIADLDRAAPEGHQPPNTHYRPQRRTT